MIISQKISEKKVFLHVQITDKKLVR